LVWIKSRALIKTTTIRLTVVQENNVSRNDGCWNEGSLLDHSIMVLRGLAGALSRSRDASLSESRCNFCQSGGFDSKIFALGTNKDFNFRAKYITSLISEWEARSFSMCQPHRHLYTKRHHLWTNNLYYNI